jgi:RNA polymerase sigma factor (TIGR02999 family)
MSELRQAGRSAADELYRVAYDELMRIGRGMRRSDPFAQLTTRTLVHEAYLKLAASPNFEAQSAAHLKNILRRAMRQVLVDSSRWRRAARRDGVDVPIDSAIPEPQHGSADRVLAVHDALTRLEGLDPRQAAVIECRFFAGYTIAETAELLGVSATLVKSDYRAARAWLESELEASL